HLQRRLRPRFEKCGTIRQILRTNGVEPKAAEIGFFSLQPVYDWKKPTRKLITYRVKASVSLKIKDFSKDAPILKQITDTDVTKNQTINYTMENIDTSKTKAVEDAYRRARESANAVAVAGGRSLGELSYASVDTFENIRVQPMMGKMMAMNAAAPAPAPTE